MKSSAFMFPGYGAHRLGMIEGLPSPEWAIPYLDALEAMTDRPVALLEKQGPEQLFDDPIVSVPALVLASYGWFVAMGDEGVAPVAVAGHGVGEYAALAAAGVISIGAALSLVVARTRLVAKASANSDGVSAVVTGIAPEVVAEVLTAPTGPWIAQVNSPRQVVIAGARSAVESVTPALLGAGATRVLDIPSEGATHTLWMDSVSDELAAILDQAEFRDARIPVVPNATGAPTTAAEDLRAALTAQIKTPIRWQSSLEAIAGMGADALVECGPGASLISFGHPSSLSVFAPSQIGIDVAVAQLT